MIPDQIPGWLAGILASLPWPVNALLVIMVGMLALWVAAASFPIPTNDKEHHHDNDQA